MSRIDRDPNRGNRRIPLTSFTVADLLAPMEGDGEPVVIERPARPSSLRGRPVRRHAG